MVCLTRTFAPDLWSLSSSSPSSSQPLSWSALSAASSAGTTCSCWSPCWGCSLKDVPRTPFYTPGKHFSRPAYCRCVGVCIRTTYIYNHIVRGFIYVDIKNDLFTSNICVYTQSIYCPHLQRLQALGSGCSGQLGLVNPAMYVSRNLQEICTCLNQKLIYNKLDPAEK